MPAETTYPGVYIEELPSLAHTISAAPTSIAVFVGYTHPFLTKKFGTPVQLFSFAEYQLHFGGFFDSPWQPDYVGNAVSQFFRNGGSTAYVVGLQASTYFKGTTATAPTGEEAEVGAASIEVPATVAGQTVTLIALQPVGLPEAPAEPASDTPAKPAIGVPMNVRIERPRSSSSKVTVRDTADIVISYGSTVETYRGVLVSELESRLSGSALVAVELSKPPASPPTPPPATPPATPAPSEYTIPASKSYQLAYKHPPARGWTVIEPAQFLPVFATGALLDKEVSVFNLLVIPGITAEAVIAEAATFCEYKRAFLIMDAPEDWEVETLTGGSPPEVTPPSTNAAIYFPWLKTTNPITSEAMISPPSGFVAGVIAKEDTNRGVWKSPAGIETSMLGTGGVVATGVMTDMQQGVLNKVGVNCLRDFAGSGTVVFGARTAASADLAQEQWKYVAVRRMALFLEQSLYENLTWAVFEPNAQPLWQALTQEVSAFMLSLFRQGAFAGSTPKTAFRVECNETTTTETDIAKGLVNIRVEFAPLVPAEFVVIQIAQLAGQASS